MKKLPFPPVRRKILDALAEIFGENRYADKVIEKYLKNEKKWGSRDRRQFAESVYDIVRWWRRLCVESGADSSDLKLTIETVVNRYFDSFDGRTNLPLSRAELQSIPDWMDELGSTELGDVWPRVLAELNAPAPVFLRANRLKTSREELLNRLREEGVRAVAEADLADALRLEERAAVFKTKAFKDGHFEMQDGASQMVAPLLDPQPGERIADTCAGAGGKTLHLAALMKNRGTIVAMDIHQWKLDELKKRARRAGAHLIDARLIESTKTIKRLEEAFDRVLMDVPCSGMGVLRRNPDTKWKLTPDEMHRLRDLQAELLDRYSRLVKPGGILVYATCSVLPSENFAQVKAFIGRNPSFSTEKEISILPGPYDGFFAAKLRRE